MTDKRNETDRREFLSFPLKILPISAMQSAVCYAYQRAADQEQLDEELHSKVGEGDYEAVKFLLQCGANSNHTNAKYMDPAICLAAHYGKADLIHLLMQFKADVNKPGADGQSALHCGIGHVLYANTSYQCHAQLLEVLLKHGADVNATWRNLTPLSRLLKGSAEIMQEQPDENKMRIDTLQKLYYHMKMAKMLIARGAHIGAEDKKLLESLKLVVNPKETLMGTEATEIMSNKVSHVLQQNR